MDINHNKLCTELRRLASVTKKETIATEVAQAYFDLGGGELPLYQADVPGAGHNNTQNIFRWVDSDTVRARAKIKKLTPAILKALDYRNADSVAYRVACANREFADAVSAALLNSPELDREVDEAVASLLALTPHRKSCYGMASRI